MQVVVFIVILFLGGLVFVVHKIRSPKIKGKRGESRVFHILKKLPDEYCLLNDIMLKTKNGRTMQIDHIVVSPYGIFVIETKNYQGIIIGNGNSDEWRQNIWGNEYQLYNPEMQNLSHIYVLKQILPYTTHKNIHSIVVFMSKAGLNLCNIKESVIYSDELIGEITRYRDVVLSDDDIKEINSILLASDIEDEDARKEHNAEVRQAKNRRNEKVADGICPLCGGRLVLRQGRYGSFYGCSNYPKCKFTMR